MSQASPADVGIGALIAAISVLGLVFNGFGLYMAKNNDILATTFRRLCFNHCIASFGICFNFLAWVAPMTLTQVESLSTSLPGKMVGQLSTYLWNVSMYSHLAVSIDRLISIAFPLKVNSILEQRNSLFFTFFPWLLSVGDTIQNFWYKYCYIVYHPHSWEWAYDHSTQCGRILPLFNMYKNFTVIGMMALVDCTTLFFLHKHHKDLTNDGIKSSQIDTQRRRREILFFVQAVLQGFLLFDEQINFHLISKINSNKYYAFFFTTFTWVACHTLDGLVYIPSPKLYGNKEETVHIVEKVYCNIPKLKIARSNWSTGAIEPPASSISKISKFLYNF